MQILKIQLSLNRNGRYILYKNMHLAYSKVLKYLKINGMASVRNV